MTYVPGLCVFTQTHTHIYIHIDTDSPPATSWLFRSSWEKATHTEWIWFVNNAWCCHLVTELSLILTHSLSLSRLGTDSNPLLHDVQFSSWCNVERRVHKPEREILSLYGYNSGRLHRSDGPLGVFHRHDAAPVTAVTVWFFHSALNNNVCWNKGYVSTK